MLHENIRKLRIARGLNQVELGRALGVAKQTVSNWENSNIQPSVDMLVKIARYFSVSTDYLLGLDDRRYIEISGLTEKQLVHLQQLAEDIAGR